MAQMSHAPRRESGVFEKTAASAMLLTGLFAGRAEGATVNNWTDPSLWANGAPTDQMRYSNGDSMLYAQRVVGDGGILSNVSQIFGKGSAEGVPNGGLFPEINWGIFVKPISDSGPIEFDPSDPAFDSYIIKTFTAPSNAGWDIPVGDLGGIEQFHASFSVLDQNYRMELGQQYLTAVVPFSTLPVPQTIVLATLADPGPAAIGSLVDFQYNPYTGSSPLDDPAVDPGWHKIAASVDTQSVAVPLPAPLTAGLVGLGGVILCRAARRKHE